MQVEHFRLTSSPPRVLKATGVFQLFQLFQLLESTYLSSHWLSNVRHAPPPLCRGKQLLWETSISAETMVSTAYGDYQKEVKDKVRRWVQA